MLITESADRGTTWGPIVPVETGTVIVSVYRDGAWVRVEATLPG